MISTSTPELIIAYYKATNQHQLVSLREELERRSIQVQILDILRLYREQQELSKDQETTNAFEVSAD